MGIPSYYKKLVDKIKGLVTKKAPENVKALYFDFNCLIYHCCRRPGLLPYPGEEGKIEWEDALIQDIVKYVISIWTEVGQPSKVFLGIDGVVPMAKIRQQRLRRFKSVWLAKEEKALRLRDPNGWDTNCITPGTAFMRRLGSGLQTVCDKRGWSLSSAAEPGEGEHKVMNLLRKDEEHTDPIVIYGLDADLVLLTLLNAKGPAFLVREDGDFFSYFSCDVLKEAILPNANKEMIVDYVASMSLLGNDFLPHSMSIKIKEDGHSLLLKTIKNLRVVVDGKIQKEAILKILESWSSDEKERLYHSIKKKGSMRGRPAPEGIIENKPLEWFVEKPILATDGLIDSWGSYYNTEWLLTENVQHICSEYLGGLQWTLDYYLGKPVNMFWYFSRSVPPLWTDLLVFLQHNALPAIPLLQQPPIKPEEQLAMVLPYESWHLLESKQLRSLPAIYPFLWPIKFTFFSAGRHWMWECEPLIPLLTIDMLRSAIASK